MLTLQQVAGIINPVVNTTSMIWRVDMEERYQLFTTLIARCARAVKRIKSSEMSEFNLKGLHVSCLYYAYVSEKPLTATELCEICDEDKANISRAIDMLEAGEYVECNSKTQKKYNCPISLTEKGREVAKSVASKIDNIVMLASRGLSDEDRKVFYSSLTLISNNLENICENY